MREDGACLTSQPLHAQAGPQPLTQLGEWGGESPGGGGAIRQQPQAGATA